MSDISFTALVCSKILHDMAGPAGAILNGAELLEDEDSGLGRAEIAALLKTSAEQLSAQLQAFRIAYGALTEGGEEIEAGSVRDALAGYAGYRGFKMEWAPAQGQIGKNFAKLVLNAAFVLGEAARKKGTLNISTHGGGKGGFTVAAFGEGIHLKPEVAKALQGKPQTPVTTAQVPALYLSALAGEAKCRLKLEETAQGVALRGTFA